MKHRSEIRRYLAMASITVMSLGTLALAGCGDDNGAPPMQEPAQTEPVQPDQNPGVPQGDDSMETDPATDGSSNDGGF